MFIGSSTATAHLADPLSADGLEVGGVVPHDDDHVGLEGLDIAGDVADDIRPAALPLKAPGVDGVELVKGGVEQRLQGVGVGLPDERAVGRSSRSVESTVSPMSPPMNTE